MLMEPPKAMPCGRLKQKRGSFDHTYWINCFWYIRKEPAARTAK